MALIFIGILVCIPGLYGWPSRPPKPASGPSHPLALAATHTPAPTPSPSPTPAPTPAKPAAHPAKPGAALGARTSHAYGIASGLASLSPGELAQSLDDMKSLGITWVRYDIEWSNIEYAGPGQYDWTDYDKVVQAVSSRGLKSLAIIDYTPAWARRGDCSDSPMCAPASAATYAGFAGQVAARYRGYGVHNYEIWNEPNITAFYLPAANPGEYTGLLRAASAAIKSADPAAFVLTGGTAPADSGGGNLSPPDFLAGVYASGGRDAFNAVAHHPYTWPYSPGYPLAGNAWAQIATLRGVMVRNFDSARQIWITEFGAPSGGPGPLASSGYTTAEGAADHVTEALEARIATDAINLVQGLPYVGPFFWYSYKDAGTNSSTVENFFGLVRPDGSRKPAYNALRQAISGQ